jgi:hypothetical protein
MKKKIATLLLFLCSVSLSAQNYTQAQEELRSEISSYLSRQGFNPEKQSDGLKFKSEGSNYYIEIDKDEKTPMYLRLCRYLKFDDKITREKVMKDLNGLNVKYGVKVSCQEKNILVSFEMFLTKATEFTYAFNDLLSQVKSACSKVNDIN